MEYMVEMVLVDNLPISARNFPVRTIPLLLDALAVTVPPDTLVRTPRPTGLAVGVVLLEDLPGLAVHLPVTLDVTLLNTVPIAVMANSLE